MYVLGLKQLGKIIFSTGLLFVFLTQISCTEAVEEKAVTYHSLLQNLHDQGRINLPTLSAGLLFVKSATEGPVVKRNRFNLRVEFNHLVEDFTHEDLIVTDESGKTLSSSDVVVSMAAYNVYKDTFADGDLKTDYDTKPYAKFLIGIRAAQPEGSISVQLKSQSVKIVDVAVFNGATPSARIRYNLNLAVATLTTPFVKSQREKVPVDIRFNKDVSDLKPTHIRVDNGNISSDSDSWTKHSSRHYTVIVEPDANASTVVRVVYPEKVEGSNRLSLSNDQTAPQVSFRSAVPHARSAAFLVYIDFDEDVESFTKEDIIFDDEVDPDLQPEVTSLRERTKRSYVATIRLNAPGADSTKRAVVKMKILDRSLVDISGNYINTSNMDWYSVWYDGVDPHVTHIAVDRLSVSGSSSNQTFQVTLTFNEVIEALSLDDNFPKSGRNNLVLKNLRRINKVNRSDDSQSYTVYTLEATKTNRSAQQSISYTFDIVSVEDRSGRETSTITIDLDLPMVLKFDLSDVVRIGANPYITLPLPIPGTCKKATATDTECAESFSASHFNFKVDWGDECVEEYKIADCETGSTAPVCLNGAAWGWQLMSETSNCVERLDEDNEIFIPATAVEAAANPLSLLPSHTYAATSGVVEVKISGAINTFSYGYSSNTVGGLKVWNRAAAFCPVPAKAHDVCDGLTEVVDFGSLHLENLEGGFEHCEDLTTVATGLYTDTSRVTRFNSAFGGATSLTNIDLSGWDTSKATDLRGLFAGVPLENSDAVDVDLSSIEGWNTSRVTRFEKVLGGCSVALPGRTVSPGRTLDQLPDLSEWSFAKVAQGNHLPQIKLFSPIAAADHGKFVEMYSKLLDRFKNTNLLRSAPTTNKYILILDAVSPPSLSTHALTALKGNTDSDRFCRVKRTLVDSRGWALSLTADNLKTALVCN